MTSEQARLLLESLLARLDADAASGQPQLRHLVSDMEREALRSVLEDRGDEEPLTEPQPEEPEEQIEEESALEPVPVGELNTTALGYEASPKPEWTLCLDFGTAKSKAFAATDSEDPDLLPLPIGKADDDLDGSVHEVSSSIWIDDDGLLFMGSEAIKRGIAFKGSNRRRLDSLKQEISQLHPESDQVQLHRKLPDDVDPTSTLTYSDAIVVYLAYLTDLATTELKDAKQVGTRYVRRRFTLPWWNKLQREWAGKFLTRRLNRAQLVADTFHGKWRSGIHVDLIRRILQEAAAHDDKLEWMVRTDSLGGVLEALAAASARIWTDSSARDVMLVVDVGAGTTDISLFWVVQRNDKDPIHRAWPIEPCGTAIRQAGDTLDSLLVSELMKKANLGADRALQRRVSDDLFRKGIRRLKETLFETGEITERLVSDHIVKLTREEFVNSKGVQSFELQIQDQIRKLLVEVDDSWSEAARDGITLVLTGGGSSLPMVRSLAYRRWKVGNRGIVCRLATAVPDAVREQFSSEFIREYPRLTVAMGGALDMLLDERDTMTNWPGAAPPRRGETTSWT